MNTHTEQAMTKVITGLIAKNKIDIPQSDTKAATVVPMESLNLQEERLAIPESNPQAATLLPTESHAISSILDSDEIITPEIMDDGSEVETAVSKPRHTYLPPVKLFSDEPDNYGPQRTLDDLLDLEDEDKSPAERKYGFPVIVEAGESSMKFSFNQRAIAGTFHMDVHQSLMIYVPGLKNFFLYNHSTGLWKHTSDMTIQGNISEYSKRITPEYYWSKINNSLVVSVFNMVKQIAARDQVFQKKSKFIHVENGVLQYKDGKFEMEDFTPFHLSRNRTEISYVKDAKCPKFIEILMKPALSKADIKLIQMYAGQCLLGRNISQKLLLLRGTPGGGKSTLVNIIKGVIGSVNVGELRPSHLTQRFELTRYNGKTLLVGPDVKSKFLNTAGASVIKALVGNDYMEGEVKGGNEVVPMVGNFNIMITTNSHLLVKLESDAAAWKRRLLIVDYDCPPPEVVIPDLDEHLIKNEGEGILRWCVEGAEMLLAELTQGGGRLTLTEEQDQRINDLLNQSNSIRSFVNDWIETDPESTLTSHEAFAGYQRYCVEKGWDAQGKLEFWHEIQDVMMEFYHVKLSTNIKRYASMKRGYKGVKLTH